MKELADQLAKNNKEKDLIQMKINKLQKDLNELTVTD